MNKIETILEKYFEGKTSLKEEKLLRKYFLQNDIPEHLWVYKPIFNFFSEEFKDVRSKKLGVGGKKLKVGSKNKVIIVRMFAGIAASLFLFFTLKNFLVQDQPVQGKSMVYIGGVKYTEPDIVNSKALNALKNISNTGDDIINSQIDILNSFNDF